LFHGFDTLGSPLEGRRVPWLRRGICPLANPYELWYDNLPSTELKLKIPQLKQTNSKRDETWTRGLLRQRTTHLPKIFSNGHRDQNRSDLFPKPVRPVSPRQTGKTQPAETTSSSNQSISRFTQRIATKLRWKVDYLLGNLYLKGSILKCIQKRGIESQLPRTPFPSSSKNHQIEYVSEGLLE
jgi:hypothetical protein